MTEEVFTPKQYAEWLVDNFLGCLIKNSSFYISNGLLEEQSKKLALIAVNEIIMSTRVLVNHYIKNNGVKAYIDIEFSKNLTLAYYKEVKQEIKKL